MNYNKILDSIKNNFLGLNKFDCENLKLTFCNASIDEVEKILNDNYEEQNELLVGKKHELLVFEVKMKDEEKTDKLCLNHSIVTEEFIRNYRETFLETFKDKISCLSDNNSISVVIDYEGKLPCLRNIEEDIKDFYTVHLDKILLKELYKYKDTVKFIFYKYKDRYEIISLKKIPSLIEDVLDKQEWKLDTEVIDKSKLYRDI